MILHQQQQGVEDLGRQRDDGLVSKKKTMWDLNAKRTEGIAQNGQGGRGIASLVTWGNAVLLVGHKGRMAAYCFA